VIAYTSGLDHIVSTPEDYGWSFDGSVGGGTDPEQVARLRQAVFGEPSIADVAVATIVGGVIELDGEDMQAWSFDDVRGHIGPTVIDGRAPRHDDEVLVGTKSAQSLSVGIGDRVRATGIDGRPATLRVVGTGLFASIEGDDFTQGAVMTTSTLHRVAGNAFGEFGGREEVVFTWVPGTDVRAAEARMREQIILVPTLAAPVSDIANLRAVRNYPRWLAAFLIVLGLVAATHALIVSTRRRRLEMGVLRAIGFSRRQVSRAVSAQGLTVGVVAVVVGVPIGIAVGRWVWVAHASQIGIGTTLDVPFAVVVTVALATIALTWLIATAAGRGASRAPLTTALRVE
jgi:hypothetical protein